MSAKPHPVSLIGRLEEVRPDGMARGWCWSPQDPRGHRTIQLLSGELVLTTAVCDLARADLSQLGMGDSCCGFEAVIARVLLGPAQGQATIVLRDVQTGRHVGAPVVLAYAALPVQPVNAVRACLDRADDEGMLTGWAWNPAQPDLRIRIRVLADGEPAGVTVADMFRGDLKEAGIGDGRYAFSFLLPWSAISRTSTCRVTLLDDATGEQLNSSTVFRRPALRPVEDRLRDAERDLRLLAARMSDIERRSQREAVASRAMLGVVGAFFTRLADMAPETVPTALVPSLAGLLEETASQLRPFALRLPARPVALLCLDACGTLAGVHAALAAVHDAGIDETATVALLDDGRVAGIALLPALVQNLRYVRLLPGQPAVAARNRMARAYGAEVLVFCSPAARLGASWLSALRAAFAQDPGCAAMSGRLLRDDGTLAGMGLLPNGRGGLDDPAVAGDAQDPSFAHAQPVVAVSGNAVAIRADDFAELGGFDESFADPGVATAEFCLRCWQAGRTVRVHPALDVGWSVEGDGQMPPDPDLLAMLADRWFEALPAAWPASAGRALLLTAPGGIDRLLASAVSLKRNGWQVSVMAPGWDGEDAQGSALRSQGAIVLRNPFQPSMAAALADPSASYNLVCIAGSVIPAMPPDRARALAPHAKVILALDERDGPFGGALIAAAEASDLVVVSTPALAATLASVVRRVAWLDTSGAAVPTARSGLFLFEQGVDPADVQWFIRLVWPEIRQRMPDLRLVLQGGRPRRAGRNAVAAGLGGPATACMSVIPQRTMPLDTESLERACASGVPVLVMRPAAPARPPPGVLAVDASPSAIVERLSTLSVDSVAWSTARRPQQRRTADQQQASHWTDVLALLGLSCTSPSPAR